MNVSEWFGVSVCRDENRVCVCVAGGQRSLQHSFLFELLLRAGMIDKVSGPYELQTIVTES